MNKGFGRLEANPSLANGRSLTASLLEVEGSVALDQASSQAAIAAWEEATTIYTPLNQPLTATQTRVNQSQALQQFGFHRQVVSTLPPLVVDLEIQPNSLTQAVALRTLGDSLVQVGRSSALGPDQGVERAPVSSTSPLLGTLRAAGQLALIVRTILATQYRRSLLPPQGAGLVPLHGGIFFPKHLPHAVTYRSGREVSTRTAIATKNPP